MEKEPPEPQVPPEQSGQDAGDETRDESSPGPAPAWRLTPASEKRVIRRGSEVELPKAPRKEEPKPRRTRGNEPPRVRYGYRVEITKEMTRGEERVSLTKRMRAYLVKLVRVRERAEDRMDRSAWYVAAGGGSIFFIMSFLTWFRVTWKLGTGEVGGGSTTLRFFDLGVIGYIVPILAFLIAVIAVVCALRRWPRLPLDAGSIIGVLSLICLVLLLCVLIGNVGILAGAGKRSGLGKDFISTMFITKSSQAPAYLGVLCVIAAVTSSLLRLADRKGAGRVEET